MQPDNEQIKKIQTPKVGKELAIGNQSIVLLSDKGEVELETAEDFANKDMVSFFDLLARFDFEDRKKESSLKN